MYKIIENKFSEEEEKMMKYGEPLIHNIKNKLWHIPLRKVIWLKFYIYNNYSKHSNPIIKDGARSKNLGWK